MKEQDAQSWDLNKDIVAVWDNVLNCSDVNEFDVLAQDSFFKCTMLRQRINRIYRVITTATALVPYSVSLATFSQFTDNTVYFYFQESFQLMLLYLLNEIDLRCLQNNKAIALLHEKQLNDTEFARLNYQKYILETVSYELQKHFEWEYSLFNSMEKKDIVLVRDDASTSDHLTEKALIIIFICYAYGLFLEDRMAQPAGSKQMYVKVTGFEEVAESISVLHTKGILTKEPEVIQKTMVLSQILSVIEKMNSFYKKTTHYS